MDDHFLDPGESFVIDRAGLVVLQGLTEGEVNLRGEHVKCLRNLT